MTLPVITQKAEKKLSKIQQKFNQKIMKIDELKAKLALIEKNEMLLRKKITEVFDPILKQINEKRIAIAEKFDKYYFDKRFSKKEKEKLSELVYEHVSAVLETEQNEKIIELYNRHNGGITFEQEQKEFEEQQKEIMKRQAAIFGFDFSNINFENPEEFFNLAMEQAKELQAKAEAKAAKRKKTPKQLEREQKEAEQAKMLSKTTKALYTDLAKILHPDLEHNDSKKQEKTEIMHQVTEAYEKNDIFTLLNLHIKYAQNGENKLDAIAEEQIKLYILHLDEQIISLEQKIYAKCYHNFSPLMEYATQKNFPTKIKAEEKRLKSYLEWLQEILLEADDIATVKYRLKNTELRKEEEDDDDIDALIEIMGELIASFDQPKKGRKKK
jgi:hypothetical protein